MVCNGARLFLNQALACHRWAALCILFRGASREVRGSELGGVAEMRIVSIAHPNKPMHPTADTTIVMLRGRLGAAGDWRRYASVIEQTV